MKNVRLVAAFAILAPVLLSSCGDGRSWIAAYDGRVRFQVDGAGEDGAGDETRDGDKHAWTVDDDVVVTAQRIERRDGSQERSIESVASALEDRYRLREIPGECTIDRTDVGAGEAAASIRAFVVREGRKTVRRGLLVADERYVYLVEAMGDEIHEDLVERQYRLISQTIALRSR